MSYSLYSVDVHEMWGPNADTFEDLCKEEKRLTYRWQCSEREDYIKVEWIVDKLNERNIKEKDLPKVIKSLERSWLNVQDLIVKKYWEKLIAKETCPFTITQYKKNIEVIKSNKEFERKQEKKKKQQIKLIDQINQSGKFDYWFMSGFIKDNRKPTFTEKQIKLYKRLQKIDPCLRDYVR